jgi:8-oxo-dGTP pyrophosphatase MutT (NUDIX family)
MNGATVIAFDKSGQKILLVRRRDIPVWVLPGGGIEDGETPLQAAIRETKEESGFNIKVIRQVAKYTHKGGNKKNYLFEARVVSGTPTLNGEAKAIDFFDPDKLPEPRHPLISEWFADLQKRSPDVINRKIQGVTIKQALSQIHKHPLLVLRFLLTRVGIRINT